MENKTNAAMLGMLTAAVASWDSYDKDTQRRLRNLRDDTDDALSAIKAYQSRGEQIRGRLPLPMDAQLGLALVNPSTATPEIIPTTTKLTRPAFDEESVQDLSFPPRTGTYDGSGKVSELGEMTCTFVALCLQETRAFIEGLAQEKSPSQAGLLPSQPRGAQPGRHRHSSTCRPRSTRPRGRSCSRVCCRTPQPPIRTPERPTIGTPNGANNVASVAFLSNSAKTDRAMRIRVTAGLAQSAPRWMW